MHKITSIKAAILFTVFIDVIGAGIIIPVLPFYVESFGVSSFQITFLFAIFSICSFISSPFLGALSDKYGRKPILISSIITTSIGWFVFSFAHSYLFLLLGRVIDGMAAGNISTAQSYLVDISKSDKERTSNLGLIGLSFGIGFLIGPFLGGILSAHSTTFPFLFVGFLSMLNAFMAIFILPETNKNKSTAPMHINPFTPIIKATKNKPMRPDFFTWFLFIAAVSSMQGIFALFLQKNFGFDAFKTGIIFTLSGVIIALNQTVLLRKFWLKKFKEQDLEFWLMGASIFGFLIIAFPDFSVFILGMIFLSFIQSVLRVIINSKAIGSAKPQEKGEISGIMTSIASLGMAAGPLIAGYLFNFQSFYPFLLSAALMLMAFSISYINRRKLHPATISIQE